MRACDGAQRKVSSVLGAAVLSTPAGIREIGDGELHIDSIGEVSNELVTLIQGLVSATLAPAG